MNTSASKHAALLRRHRRVRATVKGIAEQPRLSIFRSVKHISAQIIDDRTGKTLVAATEAEAKAKGTKTERAVAIGTLIATKAKAAKITKVVFDRGGHRYHGRIKALADAARAAGLLF